MSISLAKERAEKIGRILLTKGITQAPIMRVGDALDISLSMRSIIDSDALQQAFNQTMGVSVKFDDNGELDVFKFDDRCEYVGTADTKNYATFLKDNHIRARGGTAYAPIVDAALDFFFKPKKTGGILGGLFGGKTEVNNMPVLMLVHTDGEPGDSLHTIEAALRRSEAYPIYWHFVGVGGGKHDFRTIHKLATDLPNVGEVYLPSFNMSDDEVYSQLICDELVEWIGKWTQPQAAHA